MRITCGFHLNVELKCHCFEHVIGEMIMAAFLYGTPVLQKAMPIFLRKLM